MKPVNALLSTIVWLASSAAVAAPQAVPVDGPALATELRALADDRATFAADGHAMPLADLAIWGQFAEPTRGPLVLLADGGQVVADVFKADAERLTIDSNFFGAPRLKYERLAGVVFRLPAGRLERDRLLDDVRTAQGDSDWLVLDNGDRVGGLLESIDDEQIVFRAQVGPLKLPLARVAVLGFNPSLRAAGGQGKALTAWIGFGDGSRLRASAIALDERTLQFTAAGEAWKAPPRLAALQPLGPRVEYLSDRQPDGYRHVPYLDLAWPWKADRSVTGGLLRCDGRLWLKGLGMHSTSRLSYTLDGAFRRFDALAGIDDATDGGGSVRFRVLVDDRERFTSETIRGRHAPVPVSVDVAGGKRLHLVVDFADRADVLDRAVWLNARLVR
jgi:hypothetical protein